MGFYIKFLKGHHDLEVIHKCQLYIPYGYQYTYGEAIEESIFYNKYDDNFIAANGEYSTVINFCPWCGIDLKTLK